MEITYDEFNSAKPVKYLSRLPGGQCELVEDELVPTQKSPYGWGFYTNDGVEPIAGEKTEIQGWGALDGPAVLHGGSAIPLAALLEK